MNEYSSQKPGMIQAIAIMCLISGILNIMWGIGLSITLLVGLVTICLIPLGVFAIVVGVFEILYAIELLPDPIRAKKPAQHVAIMEIINIISGNVISLIIGVLSLIFYNDPQVKAYFEAGSQSHPAQ